MCWGREEGVEGGGIDNNQASDETGEPILFGRDGGSGTLAAVSRQPRLDK